MKRTRRRISQAVDSVRSDLGWMQDKGYDASDLETVLDFADECIDLLGDIVDPKGYERINSAFNEINGRMYSDFCDWISTQDRDLEEVMHAAANYIDLLDAQRDEG